MDGKDKKCKVYRKIPKISLSKYKPPKMVAQKNPPLNCPSKYKPPGGLYLESCPKKNKVKQSNNGKFTSNFERG